MNFKFRSNAFPCLRAQMNLTGNFIHFLHDVATDRTVKAIIQTEVYLDQVTVVIRMGPSVNSLNLPANSLASARKVAAELEAIANGRADATGSTALATSVDHAA